MIRVVGAIHDEPLSGAACPLPAITMGFTEDVAALEKLASTDRHYKYAAQSAKAKIQKINPCPLDETFQ